MHTCFTGVRWRMLAIQYQTRNNQGQPTTKQNDRVYTHIMRSRGSIVRVHPTLLTPTVAAQHIIILTSLQCARVIHENNNMIAFYWLFNNHGLATNTQRLPVQAHPTPGHECLPVLTSDADVMLWWGYTWGWLQVMASWSFIGDGVWNAVIYAGYDDVTRWRWRCHEVQQLKNSGNAKLPRAYYLATLPHRITQFKQVLI